MALTHNSTVSDTEPDWSEVDTTRLPRQAFADQGDEGAKSSWGFPHHWIQNGGGLDENGIYTTGEMFLHRGGLNAAWAAANGARAGQEASAEIKAHLNAHRKALGLGEWADQTKSAEWETFDLEIDRSAFAQDGRGWDPAYIKQVYENTLIAQDKAKRKFPVKPGHGGLWQKFTELMGIAPQASDGWMSDFKLKKSTVQQGEYIITAKVSLTGKLLEDYKAGKLPSRSTETQHETTLPDGRKIGPSLTALALLGADQPALSDLKKMGEDDRGMLRKLYDFCAKALKSVDNEVKNMDKESNAYDADAVGKIKDGLTMAMAGLEAIMANADGAAPPETPPMPKEGDAELAAEVKSLKAKVAEAEKFRMETEFAKLVTGGHATLDHKNAWTEAAEKLGLEKANALFTIKSVKVPPKGELPPPPAGYEANADRQETVNKAAMQLNVPKDILKLLQAEPIKR